MCIRDRLWQVRYSNKKKLKMKFTDKNVVFSERGDSRYFFVNLSVTNIGNRNVIVRNWGMKAVSYTHLFGMKWVYCV